LSESASDALVAFIAGCQAEPDIQLLLARWPKLVRLLGFDVSALGSWTGGAKDRPHRFYYNDWPQAWLDEYTARGFFYRDFVVEESRRRMRPFFWSELGPALARPNVEEIFRAARAHGWVDGFAVPIRGAGGYEGLVSLAARETVTLSPVERALLETAAREFIERCRATVGLGLVLPALSELTERELECMRWVSLGKTDSEVGQLLGISKATAHFHVEQVKRKLDVGTRVQAVSLLVLYGAI
jgi:DNA-binding CsgD family transcriptional regulator